MRISKNEEFQNLKRDFPLIAEDLEILNKNPDGFGVDKSLFMNAARSVLGVGASTDLEFIKKKYHRLCIKYHHDKMQTAADAAQYQEHKDKLLGIVSALNSAYGALSESHSVQQSHHFNRAEDCRSALEEYDGSASDSDILSWLHVAKITRWRDIEEICRQNPLLVPVLLRLQETEMVPVPGAYNQDGSPQCDPQLMDAECARKLKAHVSTTVEIAAQHPEALQAVFRSQPDWFTPERLIAYSVQYPAFAELLDSQPDILYGLEDAQLADFLQYSAKMAYRVLSLPALSTRMLAYYAAPNLYELGLSMAALGRKGVALSCYLLAVAQAPTGVRSQYMPVNFPPLLVDYLDGKRPQALSHYAGPTEVSLRYDPTQPTLIALLDGMLAEVAPGIDITGIVPESVRDHVFDLSVKEMDRLVAAQMPFTEIAQAIPLFLCLKCMMASRDAATPEQQLRLTQAYIHLQQKNNAQALMDFIHVARQNRAALASEDRKQLANLIATVSMDPAFDTLGYPEYKLKVQEYVQLMLPWASTNPDFADNLNVIRGQLLRRLHPAAPQSSELEKQNFVDYLTHFCDLINLDVVSEAQYYQDFFNLLWGYNIVSTHADAQQQLVRFFVKYSQRYPSCRAGVLTLVQSFSQLNAGFALCALESNELLETFSESDVLTILKLANMAPQNELMQQRVVACFISSCGRSGNLPKEKIELLQSILQNNVPVGFAQKVLDATQLYAQLPDALCFQLYFTLHLKPEPNHRDGFFAFLQSLPQSESGQLERYLNAPAVLDTEFVNSLLDCTTLLQLVLPAQMVKIIELAGGLPDDNVAKQVVIATLLALSVDLTRDTSIVVDCILAEGEHNISSVIASPGLFSGLPPMRALELVAARKQVPEDQTCQDILVKALVELMSNYVTSSSTAVLCLNQIFTLDPNLDAKLRSEPSVVKWIEVGHFDEDISHLSQDAQIIIAQRRYYQLLTPVSFHKIIGQQEFDAYVANHNELLQKLVSLLPETEQVQQYQRHAKLLEAVFALKAKAIKHEAKQKELEHRFAAKDAHKCANDIFAAAKEYLDVQPIDPQRAENVFKKKTADAVAKAYPRLKEHRDGRIALANVGVALAGLVTGVVPYMIVLIVHKVKTKHWAFWYKSDSAKKLAGIEHAMQETFEKVKTPTVAASAA